VLILTDDQRWDTVDVMPTVERELVGRGVTFSDAVVVNPLCCPSRSSILTGQYSHTTGVYTNTTNHGGFTAFRDVSTVATWLHDGGYRTALIGKYLNGYGPKSASYIPPGWDRWFVPTGLAYFDYRISDDGTLRSFGSSPKDYSTDVLMGQAVDFIEGTPAKQPLFLYLAPHAPHLPATPSPGDRQAFSDTPLPRPPSYDEADVSDKPARIRRIPRFDAEHERQIERFQRNMLRSLLPVDRGVGRIVGALADTHRLANTLLVFMSDNGWLAGEHRLNGKNAPYEESIRVPMVIRYDPMTAKARTDPHLVANIDLAPTFAALAGVGAPGVEGRSLAPLLGGASGSWRQDVLIEHLQDQPADIPSYCAVRTPTRIYVAYETGEAELYDLAADPYELQNRADDPAFAGAVKDLRGRLRQLCDPPPPGFSVP
jgi:N-acetylglucosamine-6-sulfatase